MKQRLLPLVDLERYDLMIENGHETQKQTSIKNSSTPISFPFLRAVGL
jgi:hypothetical protein